ERAVWIQRLGEGAELLLGERGRERQPVLAQLLEPRLQVVALETEDDALRGVQRLVAPGVRVVERETHAAGVELGPVRRLLDHGQAERLAVEREGAAEIAAVEEEP